MRVVAYLISNRALEFLAFASERPEIFSYVIKHTKLDSVTNLIVVMIQTEHDYAHFQNNYFSPSLAKAFGKVIEKGCHDDDLKGLSEIVQSCSIKLPNTQFLHSLLESEEFLRPLIKKSFQESAANSYSYLSLLTKLAGLLERSVEYLAKKDVFLPPLIKLILGQETQEENVLKSLHKALYKPSGILPPSIQISTGILSPLGSYRLQCVNFVYALLKTNYKSVDSLLISEQILVRTSDLFFQFKWNNILHSLFEHMVVFMLNTKPTPFILHILRDCRLVEKILQATQNFEQENAMKSVKERKKPHTGYMGTIVFCATT